MGELLPRVLELTSAARLSLSLLRRLRGLFDLPSDAPIERCLAAAARGAQAKQTVDHLTQHLCPLLGLQSLDAVIPAVRQLRLAAQPAQTRAMLGGGVYAWDATYEAQRLQ